MIKRFMSFMPMMDADDGLDIPDSAETGEEELESADPTDEAGVEEEEPAALPEKSDATFANMRRQLEEAERREKEWQQREQEWQQKEAMYDRALGNWFDGDHKAEQAIAYFDETTVDEVIGNMEREQEVNSLKTELAALKKEKDKFEFDNLRAQDLKEIKEAYPDADIKDVLDLGERFFQLRSMGIPAKTVYEGMQMEKGTAPKPIGKAKTSAPAKDFISREEVEAMSSEQRTKNYDLIRKSMSKW